MGKTGYHLSQGRAADLCKVCHSSRTDQAQLSGFQPCSVIPGEVIHTPPKGRWILQMKKEEVHGLQLSINVDTDTESQH